MNYSGTTSDDYHENDFSGECQKRLGYHPVRGLEQRNHFEQNRYRFMALWDYLDAYGESRELSLAKTALQEALMWANAHVACNDVGVE